MTVTIPSDLEEAVRERAHRDQISIEAFVRSALLGQLRLDDELLDELKAWQEVSDEAVQKVERMCD